MSLAEQAIIRGTSIFVTNKSKTKIIEHKDIWDLSELRDLPDQEIFSTVMDFVFCWRPIGSFRFVPKVFEEAVKVAAWQVGCRGGEGGKGLVALCFLLPESLMAKPGHKKWELILALLIWGRCSRYRTILPSLVKKSTPL